MISICIPVYNFNVSQLLHELSKQISTAKVPIEVILIDDCSSNEFKKLNESSCKKLTYIELDKNIGRAGIRNLFVNYAHYENLLFLDCDSLIISDDFLMKYVDVIKVESNLVICGGRIFDTVKPKKDKLLRWKYGIKRESQSSVVRNLSPNKSFMTNNFLIKKNILTEIKFDERLHLYGHEDTLFGYQLKKKGIDIKHIENPVLNGDIETNTDYLAKTEQGILNLISILKFVDYDMDFIREVSILNFYTKIKSAKLTGIILLKFRFLKPFIKYLLLKGCINLWLFDFYKLGYLTQCIKKQSIINT